jgi:hypothetical protein
MGGGGKWLGYSPNPRFFLHLNAHNSTLNDLYHVIGLRPRGPLELAPTTTQSRVVTIRRVGRWGAYPV